MRLGLPLLREAEAFHLEDNMKESNVSGGALRVLASFLVLAFDVARDKAADVVARIKPLVEPPDDLRVTSRLGAQYSGIIVLDRSEVIGGIVVQTGQALASPPLITPPPSTTFGSRPSYAEPRSSERLPSWAEDPRDNEDEEPPLWRRR
jgi:hypothetical protein